jgi:hypothetical protein
MSRAWMSRDSAQGIGEEMPSPGASNEPISFESPSPTPEKFRDLCWCRPSSQVRASRINSVDCVVDQDRGGNTRALRCRPQEHFYEPILFRCKFLQGKEDQDVGEASWPNSASTAGLPTTGYSYSTKVCSDWVQKGHRQLRIAQIQFAKKTGQILIISDKLSGKLDPTESQDDYAAHPKNKTKGRYRS